MTIGARLKEERTRLGLSQEAFSAHADASKRSQIDWEKGNSYPTAAALSALAQALPIDLLYVLTGRREGVSGSGLSVRDAEARLDQIDAELHRAGVTLPSNDGRHRTTLNSIAIDESLPDRVRARADMILRLAFNDTEAERRHIEREARYQAAVRRARVIVDDGFREVGWSPSPRVRAALERMIATPTDAQDELAKWLVTDLLNALLEERVAQRE